MTYDSTTQITDAEALYSAFFNALPGSSLLLKNDAPTYTILAATEQYLKDTEKAKGDLIGRAMFEAFPSNPHDPTDTGERDLRSSLTMVQLNKKTHKLPVQRYDLRNEDGSFSEHYWQAENNPVFSSAGEVEYIIHTVENITAQVKSQAMEDRMKGMETTNNIFMQTPIPVCILIGPELMIELANEPTLQLWGRTKDVIGKTLEEAVPEVKGQGYTEMIREVMETGVAKEIYESPVTLLRYGKHEVAYINYTYQPFYEKGNTKPVGVLAIGQDVTERMILKEALEEKTASLKKSDEKLSSFLEAVPQIVWTNLPNGEIDFYNQQWFNYTGLTYQQSKEWGWQEVIHPDDLPSTMTTYIEKLQEGEEIVLENRFKRYDGQYRWQLNRAIPIKDGEGAIKFWLGICTDIHDRKLAEDALKQTESNLRNTILQAPVAICIFRGPQFIVEIANDSMYELWGRGEEEVLGKSIFEGMPEVSHQGYEELLTRVYTTGERFTANGTPVKLPRNGSIETVYINLLYEAFREADGTISGVIAVAIDVSEQVVSRLKIEESNKEFQFVTDFMPQMIWVTRPDGYHYYYNKQWYDYTGLTYEETSGEGWNAVFHPEDRKRSLKAWQHSIATGTTYEIEYRCRRYDGEYRWFLGRALPLKDANGNILKWFGTCTDIHDQKLGVDLLERAVQERTIEMREANEQLKQFTYAASHDLQEPLRKISYFIDRLLTNLGPKLGEEDKKITCRIQHTALRMRSLIDDLLAYSNTSFGITGFENVYLTETIKDVLDDLEATILQKNAKLDIEAMPTIKGEQRQFRQLFQNLISNALKYHKKDSVPHIRITSKKIHGKDIEANIPSEFRNEEYYLIQVIDNGIGFDPDDADRIFRLFQRLHGKAEYEGTGVGLAIVQKVMENHQGYIWAESEPRAGSTFNVLLPAG